MFNKMSVITDLQKELNYIKFYYSSSLGYVDYRIGRD